MLSGMEMKWSTYILPPFQCNEKAEGSKQSCWYGQKGDSDSCLDSLLAKAQNPAAQSIHNKLPPYPKGSRGGCCPKQGHWFLIPLHRFPEKTEIRFLHLLGKTSTRLKEVMKPSCANWPQSQVPFPFQQLQKCVKMPPQVLTHTCPDRAPSKFRPRCLAVEWSWLLRG